MSEDDSPQIRKYLRDLEPWQLQDYPLKNNLWPGVATSGKYTRPVDIRAMSLLRSFRPVMSCHHINLGQNRISSAGKDAEDEFWYSNQSVGFSASYPSVLADIFDYFLSHCSNSANVITTATSVSAASSANLTLTCAAGHAYQVLVAQLQNNNRAPAVTLTLTPNGGTATVVGPLTGQAAQMVVGMGGVPHDVAAGGLESGWTGPIWLQAGDTLDIADGNFVAADVMHKAFVYEDYTL